jgi:hypothetical protein
MRILRFSISIVLLGALVNAAPATASSSQVAQGDKKARSMALVKIEVRLEDGGVVKNKGDLLKWNNKGTVVFDGQGQTHSFEITPRHNGDKLSIKIGYSRNGEPIFAPFDYETGPNQRELLEIDDGLSLAITVTPKKVDSKSKPKRDDSIEGPEDDDPLGGIK